MKKLIVSFFILISFMVYSSGKEKPFGIEYKYLNTDNFGDYIPSLALSYTEDFSLIFTREWPEFDYQNPSYLLEFYKNNYYLIVGYGKYKEEIIGIDYTFETFTFGIKINSYDDLNVRLYKVQKDFYLKNGNILNWKINVVDDNEISTDYMIKYKSRFWNYSHYFDFDILNKGIIELDSNNLIKNFRLKLAYAREFKDNKNGYSISVGTNF